MSEPAEQTDPMVRAADAACLVVAAQFSLRPEDVRDGAGGAAVVARWVAWRILRDVTGWEVTDIAEQFVNRKGRPLHRVTVHYGLSTLDASINGRRADKKLRERVEACLREAAGGT